MTSKENAANAERPTYFTNGAKKAHHENWHRFHNSVNDQWFIQEFLVFNRNSYGQSLSNFDLASATFANGAAFKSCLAITKNMTNTQHKNHNRPGKYTRGSDADEDLREGLEQEEEDDAAYDTSITSADF